MLPHVLVCSRCPGLDPSLLRRVSSGLQSRARHTGADEQKRLEQMERKELKDHVLVEKVLPLWLPSLSRTLALNFEQPPTVFSGLLFSALWGQRWVAQYVCEINDFIISC